METKHKFTPDSILKLMDQVRQVLRYHHYTVTLEQTYCKWILRFIHHVAARRHPRDMDVMEFYAFLYGAGLRLMACVHLRVNSIDIECLPICWRWPSD